MRRTLILLCLIGLLFSAYLFIKPNPACLETEHGIAICAASDMARVTRAGQIPYEGDEFALRDQGLQLHAIRNEVIAFQLLIKRTEQEKGSEFKININDLENSTQNVSLKKENSQLFQAHYHWVEYGGYEWGPTSEVLPWPDYYPDALIPLVMQCGDQKNEIIDQIHLPEKVGENQSIWVDWYIPSKQAAGSYNGSIDIHINGQIIPLPVSLTIHDVTLPDTNSIHAVGEIYDPYKFEGVNPDMRQDAWKKMAHCYQQLAHQHRTVFIERLHVKNPDQEKWQAYREYAAPILSGELFSKENNYIGPGENTPVSIWRTPWAQLYNARVNEPLSQERVDNFKKLAEKWRDEVKQNNWLKTEFFAYVFDEVDGATDEDELGDVPDDYIQMVHEQMYRVQQAIDQGMGDQSVDLIWTSHTDPETWDGIKGEDLAGITRLWSPSANSANVSYLTDRKKQGDKIWFYHAGHPSVGVHSINANGIEMRTWGLITARYDFDGHFMWAINLSEPEQPYHYPSYKKLDDRFGNGTLVYPGNKLDTIGLKAVPGPIPSMRLKAWRSGLQDAELAKLIAQKEPEKVQKLLENLIPNALSEGKKKASWSNDVTDWIRLKYHLLNQE